MSGCRVKVRTRILLMGRVKEAAGALMGDKKLKREGQADQAVGKMKPKVDRLIDKWFVFSKGEGHWADQLPRPSGSQLV